MTVAEPFKQSDNQRILGTLTGTLTVYDARETISDKQLIWEERGSHRSLSLIAFRSAQANGYDRHCLRSRYPPEEPY